MKVIETTVYYCICGLKFVHFALLVKHSDTCDQMKSLIKERAKAPYKTHIG